MYTNYSSLYLFSQSIYTKSQLPAKGLFENRFFSSSVLASFYLYVASSFFVYTIDIPPNTRAYCRTVTSNTESNTMAHNYNPNRHADASTEGIGYSEPTFRDAYGTYLCPACGEPDPDQEHEGVGTELGCGFDCANRPFWYAGRADITVEPANSMHD